MRRQIVVYGAIVVAAIVGEWWWSGRATTHRHTVAPAAVPSRPTVHVTRPVKPCDTRPAAIEGRVTARDGKPIANAMIAIGTSDVEEASVVVRAGADGRYVATQLPAGSYVVSASARGFVPSASSALLLAPAQQRGGIDLVLERGGTRVHGTITDVGGGTIVGARVSASGQTGTRAVALSASDGAYELWLAAGNYSLYAHHDDYVPARAWTMVGTASVGHDFALIPASTVRGIVVASDTGLPVPDAQVRAHSESARGPDATATTATDGRFVLHGAASGVLSLTASARGFASDEPAEVTGGLAAAIDDVRIVVQPAGSVSGHVVVQGSERGIAGAVVELRSRDELPGIRGAVTDDDGGFEIEGVAPGSYHISVSASGYLGLAQSSFELPRVEVTERGATGITFELTRAVTLRGRIEPPANVILIARPGVGQHGITGTGPDYDERGNFVVRSIPGTKLILEASGTAGMGSLSITVGDRDRDDIVLQLERGGTIAGRVVDADGSPAPGARVTTYTSFGPLTVTCDDAGAFELRGLRPRRYPLSASRPSDVRRPKLGTFVVVDLAAFGDIRGVMLTLRAADADEATLRGIVVDPDGKPAADAWVSVGHETKTLTGSDGRFAIEHAPRGTYNVDASSARADELGQATATVPGPPVTISLHAREQRPRQEVVFHVTYEGRPAPPGVVACQAERADSFRRSWTSTDATLHIKRVLPADYRCTFTSDAGHASTQVEVATSRVELSVELTAWAGVTGVLVDPDDHEPIANASLTPNVWDDGGGGGEIFHTDARGRFRLDRVPAGQHGLKISVDSDNLTGWTKTSYSAKPGETVDLGTLEVDDR